MFTYIGLIGMRRTLLIPGWELLEGMLPVIYFKRKSGDNLYIYNDVCSYHKGVKTNSKVKKNEELVI